MSSAENFTQSAKRYRPLIVNTVKPVLKTTCIKQSPLLRGPMFRSLKSQNKCSLPVLSKRLPLFAFPVGAYSTQVWLYSYVYKKKTKNKTKQKKKKQQQQTKKQKKKKKNNKKKKKKKKKKKNGRESYTKPNNELCI